MIKEIESLFVQRFIAERDRVKILGGLCNPSTREKAIERIIYSLNLMSMNVCECYCENRVTEKQFWDEINAFTDTRESCYVIANTRYDGQVVPFAVAFGDMIKTKELYVIVCKGVNLVIIKDLALYGSLPMKRMFLYQERR